MKKDIKFIDHKKIFFGISLAIILIGIVCNFIFGTTLDIQFKGGSVITYGFKGEVDTKELQDLIQKETPNNQVTFKVTQDILSNQANKDAYKISIEFSGETAIGTDVQAKLTKALNEKFPDNKFEYQETTSQEASMGTRFLLKCLTAVAIASILMVIYVTIRFRKIGGFSAGVFALVALVHDVLMIYFMYVIFRMPIDSNFIAVVLMILGYSLNDTIVIYDRVREERRKMGPKTDIADVFDHACSKVISRTISTSITTLIAIAVVYVVAIIFAIESVQAFALPMMIGVISGCYSSICIAGPLWVMWQHHKKKSKLKAQKASASK